MSELIEETEVATNGHRDEQVEPEPIQPQDASARERFRAKRAEKNRHVEPLKLEIPGYEGELVCAYRPLTWGELKKIGEKVEKSRHPQRELHGHCDVLILACEGLYVRENGKDELLDPDGEPIRYSDGDRLAEVLAFEPQPSARETVLKVFDLANTPGLAVTAQHNELAEWMQGANTEADEETSGES